LFSRESICLKAVPGELADLVKVEAMPTNAPISAWSAIRPAASAGAAAPISLRMSVVILPRPSFSPYWSAPSCPIAFFTPSSVESARPSLSFVMSTYWGMTPVMSPPVAGSRPIRLAKRAPSSSRALSCSGVTCPAWTPAGDEPRNCSPYLTASSNL
jgi:hypothetical protein